MFFVINAITNIPRAKIGLFINAKPNIKPDRIGKSIFSFSDLKYRTSKAREKISENYGYDKYLGNCHMVPNHALIIMALLFGDDDFQKTMMIVNTAGWDTDCNSGNVGCTK